MLRRPSPTLRLRLTLLYGGLFLVSGTVLLAIAYVLFRRASGANLVVLPGASTNPKTHVREMAERAYVSSVERNTDLLHQGLLRSVIVLAVMTLLSVAFGWLIAGRVLRPLREMTVTTRQISERNLNERLALTGPRDELRELADTIDGLLARLEAHVAEQQRFAANASHELRTPLATTQAMLEVARNGPDHGDAELIERLYTVNGRAIDLTEALLLLSRADQRSFPHERVDLSLTVEEAVEQLLPLAAERSVTIEASAGDAAIAVGSPALLLQLTTNLLHNAIVHNLPAGGTVWVATTIDPEGPALTFDNTGEAVTPAQAATLPEPFLRGSERRRADHAGVGLGLAIVKSIAEAHDGRLTIFSRPGGGLRVQVKFPAPVS